MTNKRLRRIVRRHVFLYESVTPTGELTQEQMNEILKGYLEAALWTEEERLSDDYNQGQEYDEKDWNDDDDNDEIEKLIRMKNKLNQVPFERFVVEDVETDSKIQAYVDIKNFIKIAGPAATMEAIQENGFFKFGMDIWLTRNRHGAGFFDHNYEHEKELMNAAHNLKGVDLYLTDNNTIAFSNA